MRPVRTSRWDPYKTGLRWVVSEAPKSPAVTWASVVQLTWQSRQA